MPEHKIGDPVLMNRKNKRSKCLGVIKAIAQEHPDGPLYNSKITGPFYKVDWITPLDHGDHRKDLWFREAAIDRFRKSYRNYMIKKELKDKQ